nr:MAG TPA: hypothetical protein [Caudoviricetes sp.]
MNTYNDKLEHNRNSAVRIVSVYAIDFETTIK